MKNLMDLNKSGKTLTILSAVLSIGALILPIAFVIGLLRRILPTGIGDGLEAFLWLFYNLIPFNISMFGPVISLIMSLYLAEKHVYRKINYAIVFLGCIYLLVFFGGMI